MSASTINRRAFIALAPAAVAGQAVASTSLAKLAWPAGRSSLLFSPGRGELRDCFGPQYQAGLQRLWRLMLALGLPVEVRHCREPQHAGAIFPVMRLYADFLPAALAPELQTWQNAHDGRAISFTRHDLWTQLDTPEKMAFICRLR